MRDSLWVRLLVMLVGLLSALYAYLKNVKKKDDKVLLQRLSRLRELMESGNTPSYSYHYLGEFEYPSFFIHPNDPDFRVQVFRKQLSLLEKKVLLKEELQADFSSVGYRLTLMQFLPVLIMLGLQSMFTLGSYFLVDLSVILGLSVSFHLSEYMKGGLEL